MEVEIDDGDVTIDDPKPKKIFKPIVPPLDLTNK